MAISLYDVSVTSFLQTLGGVAGFLDKGLAHCKATGVDLNELVETRLQPDMLPFRFQVIAVAHHSLGAIEGVQAGRLQAAGGADRSGLRRIAETDRRCARQVAEALARVDRTS